MSQEDDEAIMLLQSLMQLLMAHEIPKERSEAQAERLIRQCNAVHQLQGLTRAELGVTDPNSGLLAQLLKRLLLERDDPPECMLHRIEPGYAYIQCTVITFVPH